MNYYEILGVPINADQEEIKRKYRNLQLQYHPDKFNNLSEGKYQEICDAYEVLSKKETRLEYDNKLNNKLVVSNDNVVNNNNSVNRINENIGEKFIENFIEKMFNPEKSNNQSIDKNNILINMLDDAMSSLQSSDINFGLDCHIEEIVKSINITYEESYMGCVKNIKIDREVSYIGSDKKTHKLIEDELIYINIPMGIDDGEIITLKNKGNIFGKLKGDVKIIVKLKKHQIFDREGLDLILNKNISLVEALNGIKLQITHLNKKKYNFTTSNKIIQPNSIEEIKELGFKRDDISYIGRLLIKFNVFIPENLTLDQRNEICNIIN
jgi:DnaJ family protein B protein 4